MTGGITARPCSPGERKAKHMGSAAFGQRVSFHSTASFTQVAVHKVCVYCADIQTHKRLTKRKITFFPPHTVPLGAASFFPPPSHSLLLPFPPH